jgi:hypothetical protein
VGHIEASQMTDQDAFAGLRVSSLTPQHQGIAGIHDSTPRDLDEAEVGYAVHRRARLSARFVRQDYLVYLVGHQSAAVERLQSQTAVLPVCPGPPPPTPVQDAWRRPEPAAPTDGVPLRFRLPWSIVSHHCRRDIYLPRFAIPGVSLDSYNFSYSRSPIAQMVKELVPRGNFARCGGYHCAWWPRNSSG